MALAIKKLPSPASQPAATVTAEQRLWLTADKQEVVAGEDERAAFLFCSPGDLIDRQEAEAYGLLGPDKVATAASTTEEPAASDLPEGEAGPAAEAEPPAAKTEKPKPKAKGKAKAAEPKAKRAG